ncbi:MAG TPA: glucokinase, partial [Candidatus Saccharicenans sp.]|nr:glucokinase [Candidatus Saccharicenans sp.]
MMRQPLVPIAFPKRPLLPEGAPLIAADVGGTKTALAYFEMRSGDLSIVREAIYPSKQFGSLAEAIRQFCGATPLPTRLSIAFAGPVQEGKAKATNLGWNIDAAVLSKELGITEVFLLNDLEAGGYGLAALKKEDLTIVYPGKTPATGNAAIIAPGTGLGEGGLFWDGSALHPFATEGGHAGFAPRDEFDCGLLLFLEKQYDRVSWERVVSGPGIHQIYRFLCDVKNRPAPAARPPCGAPKSIDG